MPEAAVDYEELMARLPPPWPHALLDSIRSRIDASERRLVVLDDDPTGGQTLHGLPLLTEWSVATLAAELERSPAFFVLTNTRALDRQAATARVQAIGANLRAALLETGRDCVAWCRSDSTLRGHFPAEVNALWPALSGSEGERPPYLFVPYFGEAGRFTVDGVQYARQGRRLIPVAETEYARDPAFAFTTSHLPAWLEEKTRGAIKAGDVVSISISDLRRGGPSAVSAELMAAPAGGAIIADAAVDRDIEVLVSGLLEAEASGGRFLYSTAASFVRVRAGIAARPPLAPAEIGAYASAGLVLVGSYVERTSGQIEAVLARPGTRVVELQVEALLGKDAARAEVRRVVGEASSALSEGRDAVVYTSRGLVGDTPVVLQVTAARVSDALCAIVERLSVRPGFLIVKGGTTASEVATRGLGVRRAVILGQLLPGVPVWRLGRESRYPGLPYVVFPGNVGESGSLAEAIDRLRGDDPDGRRL